MNARLTDKGAGNGKEDIQEMVYLGAQVGLWYRL
jgi:hypothetical protein